MTRGQEAKCLKPNLLLYIEFSKNVGLTFLALALRKLGLVPSNAYKDVLSGAYMI